MDVPLTRRCFLKWGALAGSAVAGAAPASALARGLPPELAAVFEHAASQVTSGTRIVRTGCPSHNCGGRCLLKVHVRDGVIVRIETDDRPGDTVADPQLRACVRGRAYRKRQYHPDRLQFPMKRVGKRGEAT